MRDEIEIGNCILIDAQGEEHHIELLSFEFDQEIEDLNFDGVISAIAGIPTYILRYTEGDRVIEHRTHSVRVHQTDPMRVQILGGEARTIRDSRFIYHFSQFNYDIPWPGESYQGTSLLDFMSPDEATGMGLEELGLGELLAQIDAELEEYDE